MTTGEGTAIKHNLSPISVSGRKSEGSFSIVSLKCCICGTSVRHRSPSLLKRIKRVFCSQNCYYSARRHRLYIPWRQGQRRARKAVTAYFELQPGNVVHHHDDDNRNNDISNLAVFRNQSDHMAYHHGNPAAKPIWDGRLLNA